MGFCFWRKRKVRNADAELASKDIAFFEIKCGKCGERLKVAVNKNTDLEDQYLDKTGDGVAYTLKKEAMDGNCFSLMTITAAFDADKRLLSREITGGEFI